MTGKPSLPRRRESIYSGVLKLWIPAFAGMTVLGCSSATIPPNSIISANPCIDAVLAEIAAPGQIAAVSAYSHDAASASAPLGWARALPAVGITAEEIIAARPRLLLTGNYMSLSTRTAIDRAGIKAVTMGVPASVAESNAQVIDIARAIGREAAGQALVARIEAAVDNKPLPLAGGVGVGTSLQPRDVRRLPTPNPSRRREGNSPTAIIWQSNGFVAGKGTVQDELLTRAGYANASATYGLNQWGQLPLETMIMRPPSVVFMPVSGEGDEARLIDVRRRMLARLGGKIRVVAFPEKLLFCAGPSLIEAMRIMRGAKS